MVPMIMAGIAVGAVGFMCVFLVALCRDGAQHKACLIVRLAAFGQIEAEETDGFRRAYETVELLPIATRRQALALHMIPQMYWQHNREPDDKALAG